MNTNDYPTACLALAQLMLRYDSRTKLHYLSVMTALENQKHVKVRRVIVTVNKCACFVRRVSQLCRL